MRWWWLPTAALLLFVGAATALATVALHARWWWLVYAMLTTGVVLAVLPARWWARVAFAVGWLLMVGYAVLGRPEGDWAIASDLSGYVVLVAALVFTLAAALTSAGSGPSRNPRGSIREPQLHSRE
ncbi:hypothetical protein [Nocardioides speluncae]|uniref:hypothetical protein n=1 Tax=Nocardioides speluncae TaxID=2670337 RepID=UPI000D68B45C|nr:hypothetical protein [Nocardioides speluncae]